MVASARIPIARDTYEIPTSQRGITTITGILLGVGTSRRDSHLHPPGTSPDPGVRCSGCRWAETRIYWSDDDLQYIVSILGKSIIEGETERIKAIWAETPMSVLENLLISPPRNAEDRDRLEMPPPNYDALVMAADRDPRLDAVLDEWESAMESRKNALY